MSNLDAIDNPTYSLRKFVFFFEKKCQRARQIFGFTSALNQNLCSTDKFIFFVQILLPASSSIKNLPSDRCWCLVL